MKTSLIVVALAGCVLAHKPIFDAEAAVVPQTQTPDLSKLESMAAEPVVKKDFAWFIENYQLESIGIIFFALAVVYMFLGKQKNYYLAQEWHKKALPILKDQFSYVGLEDQSLGTNLESTSYSEFTFYASGRQNCFYSLFKLDMLRRQCLLSSLLVEKIYVTGDVLTVDIPIRFPQGDPNQPSQVPIEFLLTKRSKVKQMTGQYDHLNQFVTQVRTESLQSQKSKDPLVTLAESDEVANQLIDKNVAEVLLSNGDCLIDLHITDQQVYNKYPLFMRARIYIDEEKHESALKCLKACFAILDRIVKVKLSPQIKAKCEKVRRKADITKKKEVEEEKEQKLLQLKREEDKKYNEKLKALPVAEQMKLEEKRRQADLKQQKKKMSKMVKF